MSNLFWGNHLNYFCIKLRSIDAQVLSRLFHTKIIQSTTAITSIVIRLANQLRIKRESVTFRHCEANRRFAEAIQKNKIDCHDFVTQNLAMIGKYSSLRGVANAEAIQTNQSRVSATESCPIRGAKIGFKVVVVRSADKLHKKIDCFGQSPRNDGVEGNELFCDGNEEYSSLRGDLLPKQSKQTIIGCHNLPKANLAMTNPLNPTHSDS